MTEVEKPDASLSYKMLERSRGFLCHLSMTFKFVTPFLKCFHLLLAAHLPCRDDDGWKYLEKQFNEYVQQKLADEEISDKEADYLLDLANQQDVKAPTSLKPTKCFIQDVQALRHILSSNSPPKVLVCATAIFQIIYGFADASGKGFGSTVQSTCGIRIRIGLWEADVETNSSNWKEFENLVESVEKEGVAGTLDGSMIFMFMDNSTVESCLYKGNSSSEKLFDLIVQFKSIEAKYSCKIFVNHVSGKRMIFQGTDGVSRGQLTDGICETGEMELFVPLHLSAIERHPPLLDWIKSWAPSDTEVLSPEGWFERGHDLIGGKLDEYGVWTPKIKRGTYIWLPPPAAAEVAIEEIRKARIK